MSKRSEARRAQRRQQMTTRLIIVGVVVLVASIGVGIFVYQNAQRQQLVSEATRNIVPVPVVVPEGADANAIGPTDAKVRIIEYFDFFCPACRDFAPNAGRRIKAELIPLGNVRLENRVYLTTGGVNAAVAATCAGEQNLYWPMHDLLFANFNLMRANDINDVYQALGTNIPDLDTNAYNSCLNRTSVRDGVFASSNAARSLGIGATPSVVVVLGDDGGLLETNGSLPAGNNLFIIENGELVETYSSSQFSSWDEFYAIIATATRRGLGLD